MSDVSRRDPRSDNWNPENPGREAIATVFGKQVLLGFGIVAVILMMWAITTGPAMVNSGADVTTTVPAERAPIEASTVQLNP